MNKRVGIFPGSFDPITKGHEYVIERAAKMVDHLVIGIGVNSTKNYLFPIEKRREARLALSKLPKNSNPNRHRNRCSLAGRSRGYVGFVGLSRIKFREKALLGEFPGIRKASL